MSHICTRTDQRHAPCSGLGNSAHPNSTVHATCDPPIEILRQIKSQVDILFFPELASVSRADPVALGFALPLPFALLTDGLLPLRFSWARCLWDMLDPLRPRSPWRPGQAIWDVGSGSESALAGNVIVGGQGEGPTDQARTAGNALASGRKQGSDQNGQAGQSHGRITLGVYSDRACQTRP